MIDTLVQMAEKSMIAGEDAAFLRGLLTVIFMTWLTDDSAHVANRQVCIYDAIEWMREIRPELWQRMIEGTPALEIRRKEHNT